MSQLLAKVIGLYRPKILHENVLACPLKSLQIVCLLLKGALLYILVIRKLENNGLIPQKSLLELVLQAV